MEALWSISTTVREAERVTGFIETANELDGEIWNKETQMKFQINLIKNRQYLNSEDNAQTYNKLSNQQISLLKDKSISMTYEQAKDIFDTKEYKDPPMRGRQSMSPLTKLGLVYTINNRICISNVARKLINKEIQFSDFILDSLLKFQYPNPYESGYKNWNTKPFINTLRLIKRINELCAQKGMTQKGISKEEFGIFVLSLKSYTDIDSVAFKIIEFRSEYESLKDDNDRELYKNNYINSYLSDFKNPVENVKEYRDNMIRYIRQTKYIYIRGKFDNTYIDLEPRRMTEIDSILANDDGKAKVYSPDEWVTYMGNYGSYELPFETVEKLIEILKSIEADINLLENKLKMTLTVIPIERDKEYLKQKIEECRNYRTKLQNLEIKFDYNNNLDKIEETIEALKNIRDRNKAKLVKKYSIELEKWTNVALNIINDSVLIKPNAPVGDDNEPTYTAPNGVPDIECYYDNFAAICEVTMLTSRDQWYNEGQPVMRHLRSFEISNSEIDSYCLFVAPTIHVDTLNTFWTSVRYEYEGKSQKIVPITITQLVSILSMIKKLKEEGKSIKKEDMINFYNKCIDIQNVSSSSLWLAHIQNELESWKSNLLAS